MGLLGGAGDGNEEGFAHDIFAFDQLFGTAALLVEHHRGELLQGVACFVDRAPVRVHAGQLLDEADVAAVGFEIDSSEREPSCFHLGFPPEQDDRLRLQSFNCMTFRPEMNCTSKLLWSDAPQKYCAAKIAALLSENIALLRKNYFSSSDFFSFTFAHSSASRGAGLRSMIGFHWAERSRLS